MEHWRRNSNRRPHAASSVHSSEGNGLSTVPCHYPIEKDWSREVTQKTPLCSVSQSGEQGCEFFLDAVRVFNRPRNLLGAVRGSAGGAVVPPSLRRPRSFPAPCATDAVFRRLVGAAQCQVQAIEERFLAS